MMPPNPLESSAASGTTQPDTSQYLRGNQISGAPRHRREVVAVTASARWRGGSRRSKQYFHTAPYGDSVSRSCLREAVTVSDSILNAPRKGRF